MIQGRPPKKWPFFAYKWPKNASFGTKTVFFWALVVSMTPRHPILQVINSTKKVCCRVSEPEVV